MAEHSDPEGRNAFIRKLHRASLKTRAHEVFGNDGSWVIDQFDQARGSWQSDEGFDKFVRHVLRHCKKIVGKNAHRRRMAYIQACTDKQAFYSPDDEMGPPLTCLMKKTGLTSTEAAKEFNKLYSALTGGGKPPQSLALRGAGARRGEKSRHLSGRSIGECHALIAHFLR